MDITLEYSMELYLQVPFAKRTLKYHHYGTWQYRSLMLPRDTWLWGTFGQFLLMSLAGMKCHSEVPD